MQPSLQRMMHLVFARINVYAFGKKWKTHDKTDIQPQQLDCIDLEFGRTQRR